MGKVRILIDPRREAGLCGPGVLEVANEADYYRSREAIRHRSQGHGFQTVWVTSEAMINRYDDLVADDRFEIVRYSLRTELAHALGTVCIPETITDEAISALALVDAARESPARKNETPEDWCLRVVLGSCWAQEQPTPDRVGEIIESLCQAQPRAKALAALVVGRLRQWAAQQPMERLWGWLAEEPFESAACLAICWAAHGYGEIATQWVAQERTCGGRAHRAMELLSALPRNLQVNDGLIPHGLQIQMGRELAERLEDEGPVAVRRSQGCVRDELRAVRDYLSRRADEGKGLKPEEAAQIASWAEAKGASVLGQEVALAARLLRETSLPEPLDQGASWAGVDAWLADGEEGYLGAYVVRAVTGRLEETEPHVAAFEQWYFQNYQNLVRDTKAGSHWFLEAIPGGRKDAVTVVVLLDGVPAPLGRDVCRKLADSGLANIVSEGLRLALLPTLTAVNRGCIVSGRLPDQAVEADIAQLCRRLDVGLPRGKAVDRLDTTATAGAGDVLFWHYRAVDEDLVHKPMREFERWVKAGAALHELARNLCAFLEDARTREIPVVLGCISDHGWTDVPQRAPVINVPQELAEQSTHRRVIHGVADESYGKPLPKHDYYLPADVTIARGYGCLGRRPQGAVHGGATPQEAVVYGFWATTLPAPALEDLSLSLGGTVRRGVERNPVTVRIANPNREVVTVRQVSLERLSFDRSQVPVEIGPGGMGELCAQCDASGVTGPMTVSGSIVWDVQSGGCRRQVVKLSVPTSGAAEANEGFESMFEV